MPEITVLMPVWNREEYIKESIDSVLNQSFSDFELLIMDDGSKDRTIDIIKTYDDPRIRLEEREHDFIKNLNEGISLAKGNFIARMDSDDIMHHERLRIQLKRMKANPDIDICGTWIKPFDDEGNYNNHVNIGEYFIEDPILEFLRSNFLMHPTVMIRKNILLDNNLKYQDYYRTEDYKLWFEIAKAGCRFFIEPQILLYYRNSDKHMNIACNEKQSLFRKRIKKEILDFLLSKYSKDTFKKIYLNMNKIEKEGFISGDDIAMFFYNLLHKIKTMKSMK